MAETIEDKIDGLEKQLAEVRRELKLLQEQIDTRCKPPPESPSRLPPRAKPMVAE